MRCCRCRAAAPPRQELPVAPRDPCSTERAPEAGAHSSCPQHSPPTPLPASPLGTGAQRLHFPPQREGRDKRLMPAATQRPSAWEPRWSSTEQRGPRAEPSPSPIQLVMLSSEKVSAKRGVQRDTSRKASLKSKHFLHCSTWKIKPKDLSTSSCLQKGFLLNLLRAQTSFTPR